MQPHLRKETEKKRTTGDKGPLAMVMIAAKVAFRWRFCPAPSLMGQRKRSRHLYKFAAIVVTIFIEKIVARCDTNDTSPYRRFYYTPRTSHLCQKK